MVNLNIENEKSSIKNIINSFLSGCSKGLKKNGVLKTVHVIGYSRCIKVKGSSFIRSDRERKGGRYEEKQNSTYDSSGHVVNYRFFSCRGDGGNKSMRKERMPETGWR